MKLKKQCLRAVSGALVASVMAAMILTSCGGTTPPASSSNPTGSSTSTSQPSSSSSSSSSDASSKPDPNKVNWTYVQNGAKTVTLTGYDSTCKEPDRVLTLPSQIDGYTITEISSSAFSGAKFREVTIPASVKKIGAWAFSSCPNLTKVTIQGAETLDEAAFYYCSNLESVSLNNEITAIGANAFAACLKLSSANLPAKLKTIGESAFFSTKLSGKLVIPNSVTTIGEYAFSGTSISELSLPASVKTIGKSAFSGTGISYLVLPEGLTEIESGTFGGCDNLRSVYIPASVKYIDSDAFSVGVVGDVFGVPLETVYYGGSEAAWKQIDIATGNDKLSSAEKHYNTKPTDLHF